jgi:hypothetical protein
VQLLDDAVNTAPPVSLLALEGLGKEVWEKALFIEKNPRFDPLLKSLFTHID